MRIYVPATLDLLNAWRADDSIPAEVTAYAVTPEVLSALEGEDEEYEFAVSVLAADESVVLLAASPASPRRRVVLALDVDATPAEGAEVTRTESARWSKVAAILIDDVAAESLVQTAIDEAAPEFLDDSALLWFAPEELDALTAEG